jgi:hypothetical protein
VLKRGTAFYYKDLGLTKSHVYFVLSDPNHSSGTVLCVNFTTPGGACSDSECFIEATDYLWLTRRSVVAFSKAIIGNAAKLQKLIEDGILGQPSPDIVPMATVNAVLAAARTSKQLSAANKRLLD